MKRIFFISICSVLLAFSCKSQVFENDAATLEKHFIYEVKQIDEFFERFNNDTNSFIRNVYKKQGVKYNIKRPALIRSLFDHVSHTWEAQQLDSFIVKAVAVQMPTNADFYGKDWYAEISCLFDYNGTILTIPVILQVETDDNHRSKWIIAGIRQDFIPQNGNHIEGGDLKNEDSFISPASNGNDFIQLQKVFNDKEHLLSYFTAAVIRKNPCIALCNAIVSGEAKFRTVKQIRYHFLQVRDYIFTVEYFGRPELNSGWLISQLTGTSAGTKEKFRHELLGD